MLFLALVSSFELLPDGLLYPAYLAGPKEARISDIKAYDLEREWIWDVTLGGRLGIVRFDHLGGQIQVDIEGASFLLFDLNDRRDLLSSEFKLGLYATGRWNEIGVRFGYYHLSSHLGDDLFSKRFARTYSRDSGVLGLAYERGGFRIYGDLAVAVLVAGRAERVEIQLGASYSPITLGPGSPFFAVHTFLRQDTAFAGNAVLEAGWQFRPEGSRMFRIGLHYHRGPSHFYQFLERADHEIGLGSWFEL
jgi:hypothetical protein